MANDSVDRLFSVIASQQNLRESVANTALSSGITLMQKKKYREAAAAFKQAVTLKPDLAEAYDYMAAAYLKIDKKKEAIEALKTSTKANRFREQPYIDLASIYMADKNYSEAEKALKNAVRINPLNELAQYNLGHLYMNTNRYGEAEAQFKAVIKITPRDANGYYSLGAAYAKQEEYGLAEEQLLKAVKMKKEFALAEFELGEVYYKAGKSDLMQEQITKLKSIRTYQAQELVRLLQSDVKQPKLFSFNPEHSSLLLNSYAYSGQSMVPLINLDPVTFSLPNSSKDYTVQFQFDSAMDAVSVMNRANWSISKASGGTAGYYNNYLPLPKQQEALFSPIPKQVVYDPTTRQATLTFTISQNDAGAKIDLSHLVFKFSGKDVNGKVMDPTADQYDGFADETF
jgi:tetratricopeptide (TPR) repeat protein